MAAIKSVASIATGRVSLPILNHLLLRAEGDRLHITSTDTDVSIWTSIEATVETKGAIAIPARPLSAIIQSLVSEEIEFDLQKNGRLDIQSGNSNYKINGIAAEEFPPIKSLSSESILHFNQEVFSGLLGRTFYASSTDESRYIINGLCFDVTESSVTAIATDGRRLACQAVNVDPETESSGRIVVPTRAIKELIRLSGKKGQAEVRFTNNAAQFQLTDDKGYQVTIQTKLLEGNFPNYQQVIPSTTTKSVLINREELLGAVRRASILTSEKSLSIVLSFTKNSLQLDTSSTDGEAREEISLNYKGAPFKIAFNPEYLIDCLGALDVDDVKMEFIDSMSPGLIKANGGFLYVIMPMRLEDGTPASADKASKQPETAAA